MTVPESPDCAALEELLVDHVDGELAEADEVRVAEHVASCRACAAAVDALGEVPKRLRAEADLEPVSWDEQRHRIMTAIDAIAEEEAARTSGFDVRLLLPIAAALLIGLAGLVSLQSLGGGVGRARPARALLDFALQDPALSLELFEVMGEPVDPSWLDWADEPVLSGEVFGGDALPAVIDLDHLGADELDEALDILGGEPVV